MKIEPAAQAKFERNYMWERSWPKRLFGMLAATEILLGLVIFLTELINIVTDFWHTNVFGGIWASIILFINWILLFVTVCCTTTVRASTCSFVWNFITLITFGILIIFDVIFLTNPSTCLLTSTCASQPQVISLNFIIQMIPSFSTYSTYDTKKFFLKIQIGCAAGAFAISLLYIITFFVCRVKLSKNKIIPQKPAFNAPPPPPPPKAPYYQYPDDGYPYPPY